MWNLIAKPAVLAALLSGAGRSFAAIVATQPGFPCKCCERIIPFSKRMETAAALYWAKLASAFPAASTLTDRKPAEIFNPAPRSASKRVLP